MNAHTPFDANQDWTNPYCQNSSNDPMVDALLGNAYHVVRTVYCNLGNLKLIYDFLNQYGMVLGVQSEAELKALTTKATFARIYDKTPAGDRRVTDYLYVEGDRTGILPDDTTATGSWVKVATTGLDNGGDKSNDGGYIPWIYNSGSANGGETTIRIPDETAGAPFMIVNGDWQTEGYDFEYDPVAFEVSFTTPLEPGDFVVVMRTGVPATPDNPNVSDWVTINWLYNHGAAIGGEQVIDIPYTFQSVPAVYKNGLRFYKGLTNNSYTIDSDNNRIILTEPLATNDRLIVQLGGEADVLEVVDHTVQEVARATNVKDSEVILSTDTTQVLNGKKVIFSVNEQKSYGLPSLPTNVYIQSVVNGKLTYNPGSVVVDLLPVPSDIRDSLDTYKADVNSETGSGLIGTKISLPGTIRRALKDKLEDSVSVKDFGAVGDGVADDTAAFQAAIDSKKSLYVPDGIYLISSTLTVTAADSLCIAGNNFGHVNDQTTGSVIKFTGSASPAIRVQGGAIGAKISGLFLDIQDSSSDGFDLGGAWYLKLQDCVVRNARYGVYLHYDTPDYFSGVVELTSCYFSKCANGVKTSKVDINVVKVDNCTFFDGVNGVLIGDSGVASSVRNFIVRDSLFEANTGYDVGVVAGGAQQLLVDGNYFEENTASSLARVYVADDSHSPRSSSVSITNNTFSKDTTGDLIFLSGISSVLVKQNWSAFGGIGFVRAINIDNYEIDRCSTVSGATACNVVIDNILQVPDTSVNKISINKAQEYSFVGTTAVKRSSACTRAMIQFNGISGSLVYADGATVSKTGTGKYTINLLNALPSSAYAVLCSVGNTTGGGKLVINVVSTSADSFDLEVFDLSGAYQDSGYISAAVIM